MSNNTKTGICECCGKEKHLKVVKDKLGEHHVCYKCGVKFFGFQEHTQLTQNLGEIMRAQGIDIKDENNNKPKKKNNNFKKVNVNKPNKK